MMHLIEAAVVLLVLAIPIVVILSPFIIAFMWLCRGGRGKADRQRQQEEALLMQQIHQGLSKLEQRVESLETILLETRSERYSDTAFGRKEL